MNDGAQNAVRGINHDNVDDDYDDVMAVATVHVAEIVMLLTTTTPMMMNGFIFNCHFDLNFRNMEECIPLHVRRLVLFDWSVF